MSGVHVLAASKEFEAPGLWLFQWKPIFTIGPIGITKPMLLALLSTVVVLTFFWLAFAKPKLVPRGFQNVGELGYVFVRDQISRAMIGKDGDRYMPLLVSLFFFVWIMNLMSVVPVAQFPVTSRIAYPAVLAIMVWVIMMYLGFKNQGFIGFFKNVMFPPGLPKAIYLLLAPIEFVSTFFLRPFTHAVRLFGNMFAGHILVAMFAITAFHFLVEAPTLLGAPIGILGLIMSIVMTAFELLVQALQAFVFAMLTAFYIGGALHPDH